MFDPLQSTLAREQRAFLARDRGAWADHLARIRNFLGMGLDRAEAARPALILGAGSGLEVPWSRAPKGTVGWDGDPFSRLRTLLRHGRWAPWIGGDITGAFGPFRAAAQRAVRESWSGRRRQRENARVRLSALLPFLPVEPVALDRWIATHDPGVILAANFMGQLAPLAQRVLEGVFAPEDPWEPNPYEPDLLAEAVDRWMARLLQQLLATLAKSRGELWLVHDRAVLGTERPVALADFQPSWRCQLRADGALEAWDPLAGVDVMATLEGRCALRQERWLWPVGPGQLHLVEALAVS